MKSKIVYEVFLPYETEAAMKMYIRQEAINWCNKHKKYKWDRWFYISGEDFNDGEPHTDSYLHITEFNTIFINNEQNTYRMCPWGGISTEICSDEKYTLYWSNRGRFYLVDENPKIV